MIVIDESGMKFGEYAEDSVFHIEKSTQYEKNLKNNRVKICEFIMKKGSKLLFIEAKSSCPNQISAESTEEKKRKYNEYISDIILKMRHSLELCANILLKRYSDDNVPLPLLNQDMSEVTIKLILVVKNAREEWLIPLAEKLNNEFYEECHIWKINRILVINEEMARKQHIII